MGRFGSAIVDTATLLLWGEHEKAFVPKLFDSIPKYAPHVEVQRVAGANHWIHLEQPVRFNDAVGRFVAGGD